MIDEATAWQQYTIATATDALSFPFHFTENDDLKVYEGTTLQVIGTNYTVTGAGVAAGGTVTCIGATVASTWTIYRNTDISQEEDITPGGKFHAQNIEEQLDKTIKIHQEAKEERKRTLRFPPTDNVGATDNEMPLASRKDKLLSFDSSGNVSYSSTALATYQSGDRMIFSSVSALTTEASITSVTSGDTVLLTGVDAAGDIGVPIEVIVEASAAGVISHTLNDGRFGNIYENGPMDIRLWQPTGDGSTSDATEFGNMITDAPTAVVIRGGTYLLDSNVTFPSTMTLIFEEGGRLKTASGNSAKIYIYGPLQAGNYVIFEDDAKVGAYLTGLATDLTEWEKGILLLEDPAKYPTGQDIRANTNISNINPLWWDAAEIGTVDGVDYNDAVDAGIQVNKAVRSAWRRFSCRFPQGGFYFKTTWDLKTRDADNGTLGTGTKNVCTHMDIGGQGHGATAFVYLREDTPTQDEEWAIHAQCHESKVSGFYISLPGSKDHNGITCGHNGPVKFHDIFMSGFNIGMRSDFGGSHKYDDIEIEGCDIGIDIRTRSTNNSTLHDLTIDNCRIRTYDTYGIRIGREVTGTEITPQDITNAGEQGDIPQGIMIRNCSFNPDIATGGSIYIESGWRVLLDGINVLGDVNSSAEEKGIVLESECRDCTLINVNFRGLRGGGEWAIEDNGVGTFMSNINIWQCDKGISCVGTRATLTSVTATAADPVVCTKTTHGLTTGDKVRLTNFTEMTEVNEINYWVEKIDANSFSLHTAQDIADANDLDGSGFGAAETTGGNVTKLWEKKISNVFIDAEDEGIEFDSCDATASNIEVTATDVGMRVTGSALARIDGFICDDDTCTTPFVMATGASEAVLMNARLISNESNGECLVLGSGWTGVLKLFNVFIKCSTVATNGGTCAIEYNHSSTTGLLYINNVLTETAQNGSGTSYSIFSGTAETVAVQGPFNSTHVKHSNITLTAGTETTNTAFKV